MGHLNDEEKELSDRSFRWLSLPHVQDRAAELKAQVQAEGHAFTAEGLTAALRLFTALETANPIGDADTAIAAGLI